MNRGARDIDQECYLRAVAYGVAWRAAHPGYHAAKAREWRDARSGINKSNMMREVRDYRELENWRRRCIRAGVRPPRESYWKHRNEAAE